MLVRSFVVPMLVLTLFVAGLTGGGCATKTSDRDLVFLDPAEAELAVQPQRRGLSGRVAGAFVDPRSEREFRDGHIPGAIHLPIERVRRDHHVLNDSVVLIVYGNDFNSPRAVAVSKTLLELGYRDVRTLRGGLKAWKEAGKPVETD